MSELCASAVELIKHFEGFCPQAYLCPAGVPTIGYGHTGSDVTKMDVQQGRTITLAHAEQLLAADLVVISDQVRKLVKVPLSDCQFGAVVSFTYNLGKSRLASSTLLRKINAGDLSGAAEEFSKWVYATVDGKRTKLPGLMARREAERQLFEGGAL